MDRISTDAEGAMIRIFTISIGNCTADRFLNLAEVDDDLVSVGHTTSVQAARKLCAALHPDVILLFLCDSGSANFRIIRMIHAASTQSKVLVLSRSEDLDDVRAMFHLGIVGYLLAANDAADLARSIHTISGGLIVCPSTITRGLLRSNRKR